MLAVSHGAGGGIEARDLRALAAALPAHGVTVALVEQPWRVAGKKVAPAPKTLDVGWRGLWPALAKPGLPVSRAGAAPGPGSPAVRRAELGAAAVLALSFPLHPPGRPEKSRADELLGAGVPTLVVQGGNDPFGRPEEFPEGAYELVEVPYGDHGFAVPKRAAISQEEALAVITDAVVRVDRVTCGLTAPGMLRRRAAVVRTDSAETCSTDVVGEEVRRMGSTICPSRTQRR